MTGCFVTRKCFVACLFGDWSQHPTWPQVRQTRRCNQESPNLRHSSHPRALGRTSRITATCLQYLAETTASPPPLSFNPVSISRRGRFEIDSYQGGARPRRYTGRNHRQSTRWHSFNAAPAIAAARLPRRMTYGRPPECAVPENLKN